MSEKKPNASTELNEINENERNTAMIVKYLKYILIKKTAICV